MDIRQILAYSGIYRFLGVIIGAKSARSLYVKKYIRPRAGDKILDIGCGPADILEYLPEVDYTGFDLSQNYIDSAAKRFGKRGIFFCKGISKETAGDLSQYDIVLANGVLHHLNDNEATELFELAKAVLKPDGRLITFDGCYAGRRSSLKSFMLSMDRGRHVRTEEGYINLAKRVFTNVQARILHNLLRIPYTHIIMECSL